MDQLEAIEKEHPKAVSLKFDGLDNKWYLGSAVPRQDLEMKDDQAEFLAFVLRYPSWRRREMCSRLFFGKDHSLRQTLTRVSKFIRPAGPTVFVNASDPIKFVSGFSIYAALPVRIFSRRSR